PGTSLLVRRTPTPQKVLFCAPPTGRADGIVPVQNGGGGRGIYSPCCPGGGAAASPRKNQTNSQHRPTTRGPQPRQATVTPGQVPTERHQATSSDARNMTGGQGVAGSNPAVPTSSRTFSNIVTPHKSQQKSQLVVQRPFNRRAPIGCHGVLTGGDVP